QSEENALDLRQHVTVQDFNALLARSHAAPLTPLGQQQARSLVERLRHTSIEQIYTSPFARALSTAQVLCESFNLVPTVVPELREVLPRPLTERRRTASLRRLFVKSYLGMLWPWGEDETWRAGYRRAKRAWATITEHGAGEVAVVAHSGLNSLILLSLRRSPLWRILSRDLSNGGISIIERRKEEHDAA
ncbi:MAG: histidine phosphatase family protein, partial [Chloroflexaceae bacterium]|nr:histidine phosphatase family protein [Chloroflexaceae bacterium]